MRKLFPLALIIVSTNLWSQSANHKLLTNDAALNFEVSIQSGNILRHGFKNDINSKALKHFIKTFDNATNIVWRITKDGSTVSFLCNDERVTSYYGKSGGHLYTIKTYGAVQLDPTILRQVRNNATADFSIYGVNEWVMPKNNLYEITLQNSTRWCKIVLSKKKDGSLEVSERNIFLKG